MECNNCKEINIKRCKCNSSCYKCIKPSRVCIECYAYLCDKECYKMLCGICKEFYICENCISKIENIFCKECKKCMCKFCKGKEICNKCIKIDIKNNETVNIFNKCNYCNGDISMFQVKYCSKCFNKYCNQCITKDSLCVKCK